jgi:hypothetical protein
MQEQKSSICLWGWPEDSGVQPISLFTSIVRHWFLRGSTRMRQRLNQTESVYMEQRAVNNAMSWRERHPACSFSLGLCQDPMCGDAEHASWPDLTRVSAWAPEEMTETAKSTETHLVATHHHFSILKVQLRRARLNRNLSCCNMTEVGMKKTARRTSCLLACSLI